MEASPPPEAWGRFWEITEQFGVWDWQPEYVSAHSCCDVTYWHLRVEMGERRIVVRGANAYPGSEGPEVSRQFRAFRSAVEWLIGQGT